MRTSTTKQLQTITNTEVSQGIYADLCTKTAQLAVVGLGYVGLPIALEFAKKFSVIGFDVNEGKVVKMKQGIDPCDELEAADFMEKTIRFTTSQMALREARFFVVAVPTPIDENNKPNLTALCKASESVGKALKPGDTVVYESTVYPGCTEEVCIPILEEQSGLMCGVDFKVGYSPERINPGDKQNTIDKIVKIVSGCDEESLEQIAAVYASIITAGIHKAPSIKVAEAAKVVENTQRDVNIALMNELSMIFEKSGINTYDVLQAAGTKWNFLNFYPGLVGGHCIGVDPYYLIEKSKTLGHFPALITASRQVNDNMPGQIANRIAQTLLMGGRDPEMAKILVMGITFKEDVTDIRNSKAAEMVRELKKYCRQVDAVDPIANSSEVEKEYGFALSTKVDVRYDAVVVAVSHDEFTKLEEQDFQYLTKDEAIVFDVKGILRNRIKNLTYMSL